MAIRMGVIGGGTFGEVHLQAYTQAQRDGKCELVALADLNEQLLAQRSEHYGLKVYTDYKQMLAKEELDGVSVVTPDPMHLPMVLDAFNAGCHVLVEKPMDVTVAGCEKMIAAASQAGRLLQVDFHKRFDPYHIELKKDVTAGKLGQPLYGYAYMEDRIEVPQRWWPGWVNRSSPGWFLGSHFIDLFRWIVGRKNARRVYGSAVKKKLASMGIDTYDCVQAKIDFEDDVSLLLDTGWVLPDGWEAIVNQGLRLVGTEGAMEIDSQNRGTTGCFAGRSQQTFNLGFKMFAADKWGRPRYSGYGFESIIDVVDNIAFLKGGGTLEQLDGTYPDGTDGLEVTRILCAVHESAETGRLIELEERGHR